MSEKIETVVIGAGVVGLAIARALALRGRAVLILEAADAIGTGASSRNSEVIHAGIYYPTGSLKARLCVAGNRLLQDFCAERGVDYRMCGKLIVATKPEEEAQLRALHAKAKANGQHSLRWLSGAEAMAMEPALSCTAALLSPQTGIIDSHGLMLALLGEAEAHGAQLVLNAPVTGGKGRCLEVNGLTLDCDLVVNSAGLFAPQLSRNLGLDNVPQDYLCKGNYFSLLGKTPFTHLVYPVPQSAGLGVHFTLDLAGRGRFGPDVEWVEELDYRVDESRGATFYQAIRQYWPALPEGALQADYAGIRPKIQAPGEAAKDFLVHDPKATGHDGVIALYGIESPGLTSALALADYVAEMAA